MHVFYFFYFFNFFIIIIWLVLFSYCFSFTSMYNCFKHILLHFLAVYLVFSCLLECLGVDVGTIVLYTNKLSVINITVKMHVVNILQAFSEEYEKKGAQVLILEIHQYVDYELVTVSQQ